MYLPGTEMHMVTFSITLFELAILFFQIIYFLERPSEKSRLWYLILLILLIVDNFSGGLFPAENIPISITVQNIMAYGTSIIMSLYFAYYFYLEFDLKHLRWFAVNGPIFFVLLPFIVTFIIPYYLTNDLELSRKLFITVPFIYCLVFIYQITRAFRLKYKNALEGTLGTLYKERMISAFIALAFWITLPVITYFNGSQVLEACMTNAGFLIMTVTYIRSSVLTSKVEYNKLLSSEKNLQQLNLDLQKKVKERTLKLEQLNEQRTNTFINLVHETKTPLTLINNYMDEYILKYGNNEEIAVIKYNIEKLTKDIVNFFDIERFNKGIEVYNHDQTVNFSSILENSLVLFRSLATSKNIRVEQHIEDKVLVRATPEAISRIINNLIENAIKYTGKGRKITITLQSKDSMAVFTVEDTGMGIPKELHTRIFEPYFQIKNEKQNVQGMGMGLSIVKKIASSLRGTITLNSEVNIGTAISIELPRYVPDQQHLQMEIFSPEELGINIATKDVKDSTNNPNLPYILIVEDNITLLSYIADKLKEKYNLYVAKNGKEALEKLETIHNLDLIISDVMMDTMDGFTLYKSIMNHERFNHIPCIFLTAKTTREDRRNGLALGAIDYIEKPVLISELIQKIDALLSNLEKQRHALINQAYRSLTKPSSKEIEEIRLEKADDIFEQNCKKFNLTDREIEVAKQIAIGLSTIVIADNLNISEKTVAKHIQNIFAKVHVTNRVELLNKLQGILPEL